MIDSSSLLRALSTLQALRMSTRLGENLRPKVELVTDNLASIISELQKEQEDMASAHLTLEDLSKDEQQRIIVFIIKELIKLRNEATATKGVLPPLLPSLGPVIVEEVRAKLRKNIHSGIVGQLFIRLVEAGVLEPCTAQEVDEDDDSLSWPTVTGYRLVKTTLT